jgi:predicted phage terminase large subunit-like protein
MGEKNNQKWEQVLEYLQPRIPSFCPEEPSITQKVFLRTNAIEALFGGAAGGGKSSALLMSALQFVDVPNYSAILFRRTFADLSLPGALMDRFKSWITLYDDVHWNNNSFVATFPSGARISFGYLNNQADYLRYKGSEFQFIGMDEVTEIRESDYRYMFSRLRRPASGPLSEVPLRMRCASNPAPNWVRQRFIVEGLAENRVFVPSKLTDNPGIDATSYRQALQALDPIERRRLEEGDWWSTTLGTLFERESIEIIDMSDVPKSDPNAKIVRFWDLAATEPSHSNPDPDWTVGTLMLFSDGIAYILDVKRARLKGEKVEQLIAQTAYEDGQTVPIRMEQEPGSSGKALIDQYARYVLPGYDFMGIRATGDKVTRARPFAAAVANGNVRIVRGPWLTSWLDELSSFPEACDHDDQVDSAVGAFSFLAELGLLSKRKIAIVL